MTSDNVITLRGITKAYRGQQLFDGLGADFGAGRIHGIVGHNGAGKSVLFKVICGFVRPDAGTVELADAHRPEPGGYPRDVGVVIDRPGYLPDRTGFQNLQQLAAIRGVISAEKIRATMSEVGLSPDLRQKVRHYSLGMKQKLALAQAVMEDQRLLILDEPFNALDPDSVQAMHALLRRYRDQGRTILFTSHQREDIEALSDHVYLLNRQRLERTR
ncbi:ABC-2 type transport system ATP-binding protein [Quadrisphaera granulorum]|uniref:ABC-2 type transport system ATP-binding protein n=1 Tax=Quadrisphaera granulorum TaxID=317664 RepID=A0A316AVP2_9ACTN|nr:ABC transporter ATP-binding protein [Quadrisphaera granulorum]PWJ54167.1 ABC-2 type transport system ATP-binding protein [Quadrisphaera granulorum]SZE96306.1 ABC-2 type transport system ATP-binding protein [Quadrisphaera granulorum]